MNVGGPPTHSALHWGALAAPQATGGAWWWASSLRANSFTGSIEPRRTRVHLRRRVVNALRCPLSVASQQGWFRELYGRQAREPFFVLHRPNGTVKLSGVQGCWTERGRDSYSRAAGPEHGRARSLPYRRYAVFGTVESNEALVNLPTEQMLVIRRATVRSARMPLDLVMPF